MSKSIKIKATRVMAKVIRDFLVKALDCVDDVSYGELNERGYALYAESSNSYGEYDYNYDKDCYPVIKVIYKPECYACSRIMASSSLISMFRRNKDYIKSIDDFLNVIKDEVEI